MTPKVAASSPQIPPNLTLTSAQQNFLVVHTCLTFPLLSQGEIVRMLKIRLSPHHIYNHLSSFTINLLAYPIRSKEGRMAGGKVFSLSQVAQHKSNNDCWFVINGRVLNVTKFLEEHPGGEEVLIDSAGKDATKEFEVIGHSKAAQKLLLKYQVGVLQGCTFTEAEIKDAASFQEPKKKEMEAFVIKDESMPKHATLLEFFVPLLAAGSYFAYRCLARANEILN